MLVRPFSLLLFLAVLGFSVPGISQSACFDIFALREAAPDVADLRDIPMRENFKYELQPGRSHVFYLKSDKSRARYEWVLQQGLLFKADGQRLVPLNTAVAKKDRFFDETLDTPLVEFVLSPNKQLFGMTRDEHTRVFEETNLSIHHSTFMGGGDVKFAGNMIVKEGRIVFLDNRSGHYWPRPSDFANFLKWITSEGVDLSRTEIRLDDFKKVLESPEHALALRLLETYMPELVFFTNKKEGMLPESVYASVKERVEKEFHEQGHSVFLLRTSFVWDHFNPTTRHFLTKLGETHGQTVPDLSVTAPP